MEEIIIDSDLVKLSLDKPMMVIEDLESQETIRVSLATLDCLSLYGNPQVTTQLVKYLMKIEVDVHYFSRYGWYLASLRSEKASDYSKQANQMLASLNQSYCLVLSKRLISQKINFQQALISQSDTDRVFGPSDFEMFERAQGQLAQVTDIMSLMGVEGRLAKSYFFMLACLMPTGFTFKGRSRPAKDIVNACLNYGYSLLYSQFKAHLIKHGLNPGFGVTHSIKAHHASLASDLMEIWRQIIVDDTVVALIRQEELDQELIEVRSDGSLNLGSHNKKILANALRDRMLEYHEYFNDTKKHYNFRSAINRQLESLNRSFEAQDPDLFLCLKEG